MKKAKVFLCILVLTVALCRAETMYLLEKDGTDWREFSESFKTCWVSGFISGADVVVREMAREGSRLDYALEVIGKEEPASVSGLVKVEVVNKTIGERLSLAGITVGQLRDGMDKFYENFANRKIKQVDVIYIVKMQIKGVNPDLIDAQIRYLQMQPTPPKSPKEEALFMTGYSEGKAGKEEGLKVGMFYDEAGELHWLFRYGDYRQ